MAYLVIVSHANLGDAFVETAKMICGEASMPEIKTFSMTEGKNVDDFADELQQYINKNPKGSYFVLADLYAASPCTTAVKVLGVESNYRLVTGINLGMLLEIIPRLEYSSLEELEEVALNAGKMSVDKFYIHM